MKWLKAAWSIGSSVPNLLSGGAGIWIRLGLVAAALAAAAGWGYVKGIRSGAEQHAQDLVNLERCQDGQATLKASLKRQGDALSALAADAARKRQEAAGAIQAARAREASAKAEAARLRQARGNSGANQGPCPAGRAVDQIRRGLR
ncbi:MAG TPA: hypothetical protein VF151_10930 [Gemmatimonadales bacterium]